MQRILIAALFVALGITIARPYASESALALDANRPVTKHCSTTIKVSAGHTKRVQVCRSTLVVDARSDVYGAGHATLPSISGGAGIFPPELTFKARAGRTLTFPAEIGSVSGFLSQIPVGPGGVRDADTNILGLGGISGIIDHLDAMFLVGVFLSNREPADPAPVTLDFTGSETFTRLVPQLRQVFFIGDGLHRRFAVPRKATRLYLGFADGYNFQGAPGYYDDNSGSLTVTIKLTG